jgi:hypothetical protein
MGFVLNMLQSCPEVAVVVGWSKAGGEKNNKWVEDLGKLEQKGIPVLVADLDSCANLSKDLGIKAGETQLYQSGKKVDLAYDQTNTVEALERIIERKKNARK